MSKSTNPQSATVVTGTNVLCIHRLFCNLAGVLDVKFFEPAQGPAPAPSIFGDDGSPMVNPLFAAGLISRTFSSWSELLAFILAETKAGNLDTITDDSGEIVPARKYSNDDAWAYAEGADAKRDGIQIQVEGSDGQLYTPVGAKHRKAVDVSTFIESPVCS